MEGINLSSSVPERSRETSRFFNSSSLIIFVFFLLLAVWGGMQFYIKSLDKTFSEKQTLLATNSQDIKGVKVDRIAALDARVTFARDQIKTAVNTDEILNQLESSVISNIRLTKYEFNKETGSVSIEGETDDFKYIAQQIASFKTNGLARDVAVESLERKEGIVQFTFKITL